MSQCAPPQDLALIMRAVLETCDVQSGTHSTTRCYNYSACTLTL